MITELEDIHQAMCTLEKLEPGLCVIHVSSFLEVTPWALLPRPTELCQLCGKGHHSSHEIAFLMRASVVLLDFELVWATVT